MRSLFASVFVGLLLTASAHADIITPVSQVRTVSASAWSESYDFYGDPIEMASDSDADAATDFSPFVVGVGASADTKSASGSVGVQQDSQILADRIIAGGGQGGYAESYGDGAASSGGTSRCQVVFTVDATVSYDLTGYVEAFDNGDSFVSLNGPSGEVFYWGAFGQSINLQESGTLEAGQYTFEARTSGGSYGDFGFSDYASGAYSTTLLLGGGVDAPVLAGGSLIARATPNPFRAGTRIETAVAPGVETWADVFDIAGRHVRTLERNRDSAFDWDGRTAKGTLAPAGTYFVRVNAPEGQSVVKVLALR